MLDNFMEKLWEFLKRIKPIFYILCWIFMGLIFIGVIFKILWELLKIIAIVGCLLFSYSVFYVAVEPKR